MRATICSAQRWAVWLGWWASCLLCGAPAVADPAIASFVPQHFALRLEPNFSQNTFTGQLALQGVPTMTGAQTVELDAGTLAVDTVALNGKALGFERDGAKLRIALPERVKAAARLTLDIGYHGLPSYALRMDAQTMQIASAFSTSLWMPCLDSPAVRATFNLQLVLPADLVVQGNGRLAGVREVSGALNGTAPRKEWTWQLEQPTPSYLYGFAAGRFTELLHRHGATVLRYLAPEQFSAAEIDKIFIATADMLDYYSAKAGVSYPAASYGQVLLHGRAAQEMQGFSTMGIAYGQGVLADPQAVWLGAHELAHQWWGNGVTNRSWKHFWLNEGIATFMTAAYIEHRFGRPAYLNQLGLAHAKYAALRDAGLDKSLVFPNWDAPTSADRSLVYDKGAWVVHLLRELMGEDAFWAGLRQYTRSHWGGSVETTDFQTAMEASYGQSLEPFFRQWVYLQR